MKLLKSKSGFTLIELLVVIGILAVLAAIAIPSVAGLIDRANVSADNTNANEMTNAMERFASEYELYCQDIASGEIEDSNGDGIPDNMDSAQSRVFNVTGAVSRDDITNLESTGLGDKVINRDTKYPMNDATLKAVVQNYTKTSSSTFEPKQSDHCYYYSPDCGIVVCAKTNDISIEELNELILSGTDANGKNLGYWTSWIDITENRTMSLTHNEIIPNGGKYVTVNGDTITENEPMPKPEWGDYYYYGDYIYVYNQSSKGWKVELNLSVVSKTQKSYNEILCEIAGEKVTSLYSTFADCINLSHPPRIPSTIRIMHGTFMNCTALEDARNIIIPEAIETMGNGNPGTFQGCKNLKYAPQIPNTITSMWHTFMNCTSLIEMPAIPSHIRPSEAFLGCTQFGY